MYINDGEITMKRIFWPLLIVVLALLTGGIASAKGGDKITISGASLAHDIEITDNACILNAFSDTNLEDLTTQFEQATPSTSLGEKYLITRYTKVSDST